MTKIFDLVHLKGQVYMVDKEATLINSWCTDGVILYEPTETRNELMIKAGTEGWLKTKVKAIVATTDPSLNLPLLPAIEENVVNLSRIYAEERNSDIIEVLGRGFAETNIQRSYEDFYAGYKAAKAKKYTEEDIQKILDYFTNEAPGFYIKKYFLRRLKEANPLTRQVEVEMEDVGNEEWMGDDYTGEPFWNEVLVPKVVNGFVQVKRCIYE